MTREALGVYVPCPKCGASGDENFYIGYDIGLGDPVPIDALTAVSKPAERLKVVCKKCKHWRDAA